MAAHGALKNKKYQCEPCLKAYNYHARRHMRCGYVREDDWLDAQADWGFIRGAPIRQPQTCPGYTTTMAEVQEVADMWGWFKRGQLGMRGELPDSVIALVSAFNEQIESAKAWMTEELKPKK